MAASQRLTVTGAAETAQAFEKLAQDVADLSAAHEKVARARLGGVAGRTPVRTGALQASWDAAGHPEGGEILSPLPYAGVIEWGSAGRNIAPAAMIRRTLEADADAISAELEAAILERAKARGFQVA